MSDGEYIHGNAKLEMVWVIVPTIIVFVVGILSYIVLEDIEVGLYKKAKASEAAMAADMQVDVRAFSFGWNFRYMDKAGKPLGAADAEPTTELIVPMNKTIKFDVISCSGKEHLGRLQEETFRTLRTHGKENEFAEIEPSICEKEWDLTTKEQQADIVKQTTALYKAEKARADGKKLSEEQQALIDAQPRFRGDQQFMDVNHAFWVPESRLKIDAVAGLPTLVQWTPNTLTSPDEPIQVVCAELCGAGHNGMRTQVCVIDQATFDWWVELDTEERKNANCLNLRLMNCLAEDMPSDMNALLESTAELTRTKPDATCKDAEEIAA